VTTRGATLAALLATLGRPSWWLLGLAGFLARGGILLFVLPIVALPSPLAVSNVVAPLLMPIVFGGMTPFLITVFALGILSVVAWLVVGAWIGAATEIVLIRDARATAAEEALPTRPDGPERRWLIVRVTTGHLVAHIPLAVIASIASVGIVNVTYAELVNPSDVGVALPMRIIREAAGPIVAIVFAWAVGELAGGIAARRMVVGGESIVRAVLGAYGDLFGRPRSSLPAVTTLVVLGIDLAAMLAVVDLAWALTRGRFAELPTDTSDTVIALIAFAAAWCLALVVAGLISAWRSVAMTLEADRAAIAAGAPSVVPGVDPDREAAGTIGASTHRRPGDWSAGSSSGSL
jgi:hypothetical protein